MNATVPLRKLARSTVNQLIPPSKVKLRTTHPVFVLNSHRSDTLLPMGKCPASTLLSKATWSTLRAMDKWATLPTTHTRHTGKEGKFTNHV